MAVSKVSAIARPIPTVASFSMYVSPSVFCWILRGINREGVSYFTIRIIIILMETIKDFYTRVRGTSAAALTTGELIVICCTAL